jgi:predicted Zn-dependent protease
MNKNKSLSIIIARLILLCACHNIFGQDKCAPPMLLPNTGEPNIFSPEQENFLGEAMAEHIQREYKVIEDPELLSVLNGIGERLVANLPIKVTIQVAAAHLA